MFYLIHFYKRIRGYTTHISKGRGSIVNPQLLLECCAIKTQWRESNMLSLMSNLYNQMLIDKKNPKHLLIHYLNQLYIFYKSTYHTVLPNGHTMEFNKVEIWNWPQFVYTKLQLSPILYSIVYSSMLQTLDIDLLFMHCNYKKQSSPYVCFHLTLGPRWPNLIDQTTMLCMTMFT